MYKRSCNCYRGLKRAHVSSAWMHLMIGTSHSLWYINIYFNDYIFSRCISGFTHTHTSTAYWNGEKKEKNYLSILLCIIQCIFLHIINNDTNHPKKISRKTWNPYLSTTSNINYHFYHPKWSLLSKVLLPRDVRVRYSTATCLAKCS